MDTNILKYMAFIKTVETGSFTKLPLHLITPSPALAG